MTIYTRIVFCQGCYVCYTSETTHDIIKDIMSMAPAEWTLDEDLVDFFVKPSYTLFSDAVDKDDTVMITTDSKGRFSESSIYRKIGRSTKLRLNVDFATHLNAVVSKSWEVKTDIKIAKHAEPSDLVVRSNRRIVSCVSYGTPVRIVFETHRRGPFINQETKEWIFKDEPVHFCEVEIKGDAPMSLCRNIIETLLPGCSIK